MARRRDVLSRKRSGCETGLQNSWNGTGYSVFYILLPGILWHRQYDPGQLNFRQHGSCFWRPHMVDRYCSIDSGRSGDPGRAETNRLCYREDRSVYGYSIHDRHSRYFDSELLYDRACVLRHFPRCLCYEVRWRRNRGLRNKAGH